MSKFYMYEPERGRLFLLEKSDELSVAFYAINNPDFIIFELLDYLEEFINPYISTLSLRWNRRVTGGYGAGTIDEFFVCPRCEAMVGGSVTKHILWHLSNAGERNTVPAKRVKYGESQA